ncbi:hypothetical protein Moror_12327 [Moniliophthora roreri MCA 2997]|uniref:DUF4604 domain-containing protein n=1 Tax=Moniliophthora roreri (strain MCA 2997) TaxID=1381753 RepID=V2YW46_MONRO|nr:hypothetical protein Moror_12327 [Moniliophthora roreri MCA 2997]
MSRKDKEPTRAQLSSRLAYQSHVPAFLQKLQNKMAGGPDEEEEDDEWEYDGSGRPPIPRRPRPPIPERPADNPGSEDEDDGDEKPQVVVLKEGKHLTEREVENIRRKEKGLLPLPEPSGNASEESKPESSSTKNETKKPPKEKPSLSFSSAKASSGKSFKRKVLGGDSEDEKDKEKAKKPAKKKSKKKNTKTLLSFSDDA